MEKAIKTLTVIGVTFYAFGSIVYAMNALLARKKLKELTEDDADSLFP